MASRPPVYLEDAERREMLITPPVASPMFAGIPPVITETSSIADFGSEVEPRTFIPSMYTQVDPVRAPRIEIPPPVPAELTPATVCAKPSASRLGIFSNSSRVTVPPEAPPSLSISGTRYSLISTVLISTPGLNSAFAN